MRKFKATLTVLLCICMIMNFSFGVFAADGYSSDITLRAETKATGGDGVRHSKDTEWSKVTAPDGYYINTNDILKNSSLTIDYHDKEHEDGALTIKNDFIKITPLSLNGSENRYYMEASNYITIIPGISFPRTVQFKVHARSPRGHWKGRGWTEVRTQIKFSKLP